jgi:hypothetical protein
VEYTLTKIRKGSPNLSVEAEASLRTRLVKDVPTWNLVMDRGEFKVEGKDYQLLVVLSRGNSQFNGVNVVECYLAGLPK